MPIIRNALQSLARWLARKGPREQASSGAGGFAAEPEYSRGEDLRKILILYAVLSIYGPNGMLFNLIDKRDKEAKEAEEAKNLPK